MSTPILNPNSASTINKDSNFMPSPSSIQLKLSQILLQRDPNAKRLCEYIQNVKVFHYNSLNMCWENYPLIEGNLFGYRRQVIINDRTYSSFAFAVINENNDFIQDIPIEFHEYASKGVLFFEIIQNNQSQVFSIHFANENEYQRCHTFINRAIQTIKFNKQQTMSVFNSNSNMEGSISSSNHSPNISESELSVQQPINLLPPSAFQPNLSQTNLRDILIQLIQTNDEFVDKIQETYSNSQS